jgi:hypothetical protein
MPHPLAHAVKDVFRVVVLDNINPHANPQCANGPKAHVIELVVFNCLPRKVGRKEPRGVESHQRGMEGHEPPHNGIDYVRIHAWDPQANDISYGGQPFHEVKLMQLWKYNSEDTFSTYRFLQLQISETAS